MAQQPYGSEHLLIAASAYLTRPFTCYKAIPTQACFDPVEPHEAVPLDGAGMFDCRRSARRDPHETKGRDYRLTTTIQ